MRLLSVAFALLPAAALSQTLDCSNPVTQVEMTGCASQAYEAADAELNAAYGPAMEMAKSIDDAGANGAVPAATLLRDAQRAWIVFRDASCDAEATLARGGTMQSMLFYICLERLTRARTEDLRLYGETH